MRYINTIGYNPKSWKVRSTKFLRAIIVCPTIECKKKFLDDKKNQIWTENKRAFERLSNNKCWFSEAYSYVAEFQVEHFRPKKRVHLITSKGIHYRERRTITCQNGYWWLSYELKNLRLVGTKTNQFKGCYFPLETNSIIAKELDSSWHKEAPILIDPCVKSDVSLITYDGVNPVESNPDISSLDHIRAKTSILIYGLKIQKLKMARSRVFEVAKNYFNSAKTNWEAMNIYDGKNEEAYLLARTNFQNNCLYLVEMLKPEKEFTKMVLAFLIAANQSWLNMYVIDIAKSKGFLIN